MSEYLTQVISFFNNVIFVWVSLLFGVGFWVKPYGYELAHIFDYKTYWQSYNNPNYEIHCAWVRIFAENGLALFALIVSTIGYCLFKTWQSKQWTLSFYMLSILFYLSFVTRHITLNILNALLYLIMMSVILNLITKDPIDKK